MVLSENSMCFVEAKRIFMEQFREDNSTASNSHIFFNGTCAVSSPICATSTKIQKSYAQNVTRIS